MPKRSGPPRWCSVAGCTDPYWGNGLCRFHNQRQRKGTPLDAPRQIQVRGPVDVRFWAKVNKDSGVVGAKPELGECWIWTAHLTKGGYGQFSISQGNVQLAHRFGYELQVRSIPPGLDIDHLCRVRCCIRASHLEPVTERENVLRSPIGPSAVNAAKTRCIRDHPLSGDNLVIDSQGKRQCRTCMRIRKARQKLKAA